MVCKHSGHTLILGIVYEHSYNKVFVLFCFYKSTLFLHLQCHFFPDLNILKLLFFYCYLFFCYLQSVSFLMFAEADNFSINAQGIQCVDTDASSK